MGKRALSCVRRPQHHALLTSHWHPFHQFVEHLCAIARGGLYESQGEDWGPRMPFTFAWPWWSPERVNCHCWLNIHNWTIPWKLTGKTGASYWTRNRGDGKNPKPLSWCPFYKDNPWHEMLAALYLQLCKQPFQFHSDKNWTVVSEVTAYISLERNQGPHAHMFSSTGNSSQFFFFSTGSSRLHVAQGTYCTSGVRDLIYIP